LAQSPHIRRQDPTQGNFNPRISRQRETAAIALSKIRLTSIDRTV
jgi:hypothetical protein